MKQVLCNSAGALVARMPQPPINDHEVLVQVRYSMISIGTEIAPLRASLEAAAQPMSLDRAREYGQLARVYLGAAVKDPHKAVRRLVQIGSGLVRDYLPRPAAAPISRKSLGDIAWTRCDAEELQIENGGITLTTNHSEATYQVMSEIIPVAEGTTPIVRLKGEVFEGKVAIGLLNGGKTAWLGSRDFEAGPFEDELIFKPDASGKLVVVVANCGAEGKSRLKIEEISVEMAPPSSDGLPHSELDDQGWNVGYSAAGKVVAVGSAVKDVAVGDLVACGGAGKANHASFVAVPRNLVCRVPRGCELRDAATATIGTIALQGVRRAEPALGETIAVIGLGLLGQLTVQMLKANGCKVLGFDLNAERIARAKALGLDGAAEDAAAFKTLVRDLTGGHGADRTIITAATKSDAPLNLAMEISRAKGRVVIVGDIGLKAERAQFYRKEIDLLMSTSYGPGRYDRNYEEFGRDYPYGYVRWTMNRNMEAYMSLIAAGSLKLGDLVERVVPIESAPQVYSELAQSGQPPLGVILEYPELDPESYAQASERRVRIRGHRKPLEQRVNYALVGAGAFGLSMLVPQMQKRRDLFFLKGIVSKSGVQASNYARANQVEVLASDIGEVLADENFQLVVIATRHSEHASQVVRALEAGKHVFVEKPLALNWEDLDAVVKAYEAQEPSPLLMVGFNRRFSPAVQKLAEVLAGRRSPLVVNYRLNGGYIPPDSWIQDAQGGGRNLGEACHMYDVFRFLAGAPVADISATSIDPDGLPFLRNDNFCATLRYADGSVCNLVYTALGPKQGLPKERVEVFCDGEAYVLDDYRSLLKCGSNETLWSAGEVDKGHFTELSRFGEALTTGEPSPIPFEEIVETTAVALRVEDLLQGKTDHE